MESTYHFQNAHVRAGAHCNRSPKSKPKRTIPTPNLNVPNYRIRSLCTRLLRLPTPFLSSSLLIPLQFRKIKSLTPNNLTRSPRHSPSSRRPEQSPNPRLNIPPNTKRNIPPLSQPPSNITNLILPLLATQPQHTRHRIGLLTLASLSSLSLTLRIPSRSRRRRRQNRRRNKRVNAVLQDLPGIRRGRGRDDSIPDDSLGSAYL
jgi:hypothetical protein